MFPPSRGTRVSPGGRSSAIPLTADERGEIRSLVRDEITNVLRRELAQWWAEAIMGLALPPGRGASGGDRGDPAQPAPAQASPPQPAGDSTPLRPARWARRWQGGSAAQAADGLTPVPGTPRGPGQGGVPGQGQVAGQGQGPAQPGAPGWIQGIPPVRGRQRPRGAAYLQRAAHTLAQTRAELSRTLESQLRHLHALTGRLEALTQEIEDILESTDAPEVHD